MKTNATSSRKHDATRVLNVRRFASVNPVVDTAKKNSCFRLEAISVSYYVRYTTINGLRAYTQNCEEKSQIFTIRRHIADYSIIILYYSWKKQFHLKFIVLN